MLSQDLSEDALYQDFSAKNSSYVPKIQASAPAPTPAPADSIAPAQETQTTDLNSTVGTSSPADAAVDSNVETPAEAAPVEADASVLVPEVDPQPEPEQETTPAPEPAAEPEPVQEEAVPVEPEPVTLLDNARSYVSDAFASARSLFPLVQFSTTTPVVSVGSDPTESEVEVATGSESTVEQNLESQPEPEVVLVTETVATPTPALVAEVESVPVVVPALAPSTTTSTESVSLEGSPASTSDAVESELASSTDYVEQAATTTQLTDTAEVHEITLANFDIAPLESGQFIDGAQLRLSFAAQLENIDPNAVPYVEVFFGKADDLSLAGLITLDEEVSNAINGGYFLFALPVFKNVQQLEDMQVVLRYHGSSEELDGMFLDAAWLSLDTRIVTKEDLEKRGKPENLTHLKAPELNTLVSDQVTFSRDQAPLFNLRYASQRNALVRGVRSLIGRDLVEVKKVNVRHQSIGLIGVAPEVSVTADGLLTIEIPEDQLAKMRPGTYEIEMMLDEGGKEKIDTFNFQWGILSINPNKSQYEAGETAEISIGALTPSGHTVCEANLDLYITNPDGQVSKVDVFESGLCDGNNVIDVPDFTATASTTIGGTYEMYLERLDDKGEVLSFTNDTFLVSPDQKLSIERTGPTRIYPPAAYPMVLTVAVDESFTGTLVERVPKDFKIVSTTANIEVKGDYKELTWDLSILGAGTKTVSYEFDAPDISPYLYNLGSAVLTQDSTQKTIQVASTTASTTSEQQIVEGGLQFVEHRQWQIASDAVGSMILYFDGPSIPAGWTCVSCTGGVFNQRFIMGSGTAGTNGGGVNHTHSVTTSLFADGNTSTEGGGAGVAGVAHTHTLTPTVPTASNLPVYRELQVIQYNSAGEPPTIPVGAIAIFDVASSSLPANWNRYAAQDGRYVYGADTIGSTGGSNTHAHTLTGTTGAAGGATARSRGGGVQVSGAAEAHTHTISASTDTVNNEPPYVEVLLARLATAGAPPNGMIAMWSEDVENGWIDVSSDASDAYNGKFIKPATSYGATNGSSTHSHVNITGALTSVPSATVSGREGTAGSAAAHTHSVDFNNFSTANNLPPYRTAVFGKRQGTNPVYDQFSSLWYVNENAEPPTDVWPVGVTDLLEREPITAASTPVKVGDEVRLRMNVGVTNATSSPGAAFTLQFTQADTCSAATEWFDVGDTASTSIWRGYDNTSVADHSTLTAQLLSSTTVSATYEENGYATSTPNEIVVDGYGEWDFVLQQNGAVAGSNYCFRMIEEDGTAFLSYSHYPQLFTNEAPATPTLQKLFDNEKTVETLPAFTFVSTDPEGEKIHYEIEVDDTYDFTSPVIDKNTISNAAQFENQVLISDKAPFRPGELIQFVPTTALTNGTTYYWRVRGQDPDGSTQWGEWSVPRSFTVDTTLLAAAWFQTQDEQFDTNVLTGVETGADEVDLITGSTTGSMVSTAIDFDDGELGTAWDRLEFSDVETTGDLKYQIEYLDETDTWTLIPDADLPGNSTGFDTSPVSLLALDVSTYNQLRIVSDFTDVSGTPVLQEWAVYWGYRVETPSIAKLFPNEQTGTTTPALQFTTTDPQSDSLTYQVEWATQPDFTGSTVRTSDLDAGFANIDTGLDTDPFNSGDDIQFTLQPADALTGSTTYWWRVRAKDTTGSDAYSFWTDAQSFTVIPGTDVSTWFQTTQEQFQSNTLSGVTALGSDAVTVATTATEAMVVYGEGTETTPRYRQWTGTVLSAEASLLDIGSPLKWAIVEAATTREEYVAATVGTDADVNVQVFSLGEWGNLQELTVSMGNINARGFDVAYETQSGDAMVAYCDGDADPGYAIWDGSTWTTGGTINLASASNCEWIQLEADPTSDEIIILSRDAAGNQYEAQVWTGSVWGNPTTMGTIVDAAHEGMALMYEESGDQAIIVSSDGNPARFRWQTWNGAWSGANTQTIGDDFEWGQMARDVGSDEIILCYQDEDNDVGVVRWTGAAWAGQTELELDGNAKNDPNIACVFEDTAGRDGYILNTISSTLQTDYYTWNTATWSGGTQVNTLGDTATMQLLRTGDANILGLFFDDPNDALRFSTWNGSTWSTTQTMETNASVDTSQFGRPFSVAARNSGKDGTAIVSPPIDFNDGTGPYWQSFSWNDTQPGTSEIRYSLQYQTATGTWLFIPDADLPDNEAGTTTGPFDLAALDTTTYNIVRPYAAFTCDAGGNCPTLSDWKIQWAGGITVSGTIQEYDQATNVTGGTVEVAVNGVLQTGKTGTISAGAWSIANVTAFPGDIITVYVSSGASVNKAVGITRYVGPGNVTGMTLYERHVVLGSDAATTTPLTNADIGGYDYTNNATSLFFDVTGSVLDMCAGSGCADAELYVKSGTYYTPGGPFVTHDFENNGTFTAGAFTHEVNGSWDNNATTTMTGSTVLFAATSSTESVDSTGSLTPSFNNVTFGTTTGAGIWTLATPLDVNGNLLVDRGTLQRDTTQIFVAKNLTTGANGLWTGLGTTTFDGAAVANWSDQNMTLQNVGRVVIDGTSKNVTLAGNVAAESVTIGANDTLDASASNYAITVYSDWTNQNNFLARAGEVFFAATAPNKNITTGGDAFYDLTFTGTGGAWAFTESALLVNNDITITDGVVTLPTATTTIAGSFDATGGTFANNNGVLYFTANGPETITFAGGAFSNVAANLTFNGGGSWSMLDVNATTTDDVTVSQGTVTFPSGVLAIGGTLTDAGGVFLGGSGAVRFYSAVAELITAGGSAFNSAIFDGTGSWSFADSNVTLLSDLLVSQGTVTFPTGVLSIGGSYDNNSVVTAGTGTVAFNSTAGAETIAFGGSALYAVDFTSPTGDWTLTEPATTTSNFSLSDAGSWTLASGQVLSVAGVFTNAVGGASTTWTGATLSLESGDYSVNTKSDNGDAYETLRIAAAADVALWNSVAVTYVVDAAGSLYSQDHNAVDGDVYIWGSYENTAGSEYWSYSTDFDGVALGTTSERQVDVRLADGASATFASSTVEILGDALASTTVASQGAGTYAVTVSAGTTTAQYYSFSDLGTTGVSLLDGVVVPVLRDGAFEVAAPGGTALTLASTTIDANPSKQIFNIAFATTTAITASNVTQTDGAPVSYWWFREGTGNLYGEDFDNDTGDPGSVRFDDSSLVITLSGTVYTDAGATPLIGGTCDGSTPVVTAVVDGGTSYTGSCSNVDGSYSIPGVVVIGDPTITVYLDNATGGEKASAITRTPTADISNLDLYVNRVIVRNEDVSALTIENLATYDSSDDTDLQFTAATTSNPDVLSVAADTELYVFASSTFAPDGEVTLNANAAGNSYDGTLYLAGDASFIGVGTTTYTIGGRLELEAGAAFTAASSTMLFTATTSGKSITAPSQITFYNLTFNGVGGGWNIGADIEVEGDMAITNGTVTGTGDITLPSGSLTGNGVLSLGGGTTTLAAANTLGGASNWTFFNLQLGDTLQVGTTTPLFTGTTTVAGVLTIESAHYLDAGNTAWNLSGTGNVFVENGTFQEDTSTVRYSGAGANVLATQYYNLDIQSAAGAQTYTPTGLGIIIDNDLTIGGSDASVFALDTNDLVFDINGDVTIRPNGTFSASDSATLTVAGNFDNNGTFTGNGGIITFDGAGSSDVAAGTADFSTVLVDGSGSFTFSESATTSVDFTLQNAAAFTLAGGQSLAVGGEFFNALSGAVTTWTSSTLRLFGGNNFSLNATSTSDTYDTLAVDSATQVRMWNSQAATYNVDASASLYSQDHAAVDGDVYVWGAYQNTATNDFWSYATDFDGASLVGNERPVDVYFAAGASATFSGGSLDVRGVATASTTLQNQGAGTYSLTVAGTASTSFQYYVVRDIDSTGLEFTGAPSVQTLSFGDLEVSQNGGSAITVGGTVMTANPAKTFTLNRFALNGVGSGFNVTATGSSVSSWRFTNHYGDIDGEANDVDPDGDPGYVVWDDSAANITISGVVFADEGVTPAGVAVCDSATNAVRIVVAGVTTYNTNCATGTGAYSISNISYSPGDSVIAFLTAATGEHGATVTVDPVSNISDFDIYQDRVIGRHEGTDPLTIANMAVYDSSDEANIPFTAINAGTDTLTLPTDRKLLIWTGKTFTPGGDVTVSNGGVTAYGGSLSLLAGANWSGQGNELLSVGGNMTLAAGANFNASNGTTTFTTNNAARTININEDSFTNVAFTGSGSWSLTDSTFTVEGDYSKTAGALTFPTGTSTVNGSFLNTGGTFTINGSKLLFGGTGSHQVAFGGSDVAAVEFVGGTYAMTDVTATATESVIVSGGSVSLPSGTFAIGGDFRNEGGSVVHNTSELLLTNATAATILASSSDLFAVTFAGGGAYSFADYSLTLLDSLFLTNGSLTLASGTLAIGGSFDASGGTFAPAATGTLLFNSSDTGEFIDPGVSDFYNVQISAPTGGYTLLGNATTTNNFVIASADTFVAQTGVVLVVNGVFLNSVGGANTTWSGSTLVLDGQNAYTVNSKLTGGDQYDVLVVGSDSDIRLWNSAATTTTVANTSSVYSQDNAGVDGNLAVHGDFHVSTTTEYWSYATDFDGTNLAGVERAVIVSHAANATTSVDGGSLEMVGVSGDETTVTNQGVGTYALQVSAGSLTAQYFALRNLNAAGLNLTGTPLISSLAFGDYELAVAGGSLISLAAATLNANASLVISGNRFATTTAITGTNVNLSGVTSNAWTFTGHTGNLDGEAYDVDGVTACGSVRWADSSCLLTQQTDYRWRNDDGGLEVPDSEWYDVTWDARKAVRVKNIDTTTYTDPVVQLFVDYDADMQADFDDLRFTAGDGTTLIPHWIGSTTSSVQAEVWVKVPSLAAEDTTDIFMYYNNPGAAGVSSSTQTFIASDDFEDNSISEYSGQTSLFTTAGTFAYDGVFGLDNAGSETSRANTGGMYRLDQTVSQGETFRFLQYVETGSSDEVCTKFGVQATGVPNNNYAVCVEFVGVDRVSLVKDVIDNDASGSVLATQALTYTTGWYEFEVDWGTDDSLFLSVYDAAGSLVATTSATDSSYTSGGIGFTFWFNQGGWDSVSSRPTLTTEPSIIFGVEQTDGGASWKAAQNTLAIYNVTEVARLRLVVENSGLAIADQQFLLEYAPLDTAPSCQSVDAADYAPVPVQASCGTSPVCMQSSTFVTNGASTVDLLSGTEGVFTPGEAREDPSNITGNLNIAQNQYTELEFAVTPTVNVVDQNLCFRVTDNGADYDTYLQVAQLKLRFDPIVTNVSLNSGLDISLLPGTTTPVYATGTVTDLNGFADLTLASSTIYRSGVTGGALCTPDNNNCYTAASSSCSFTACAGNSCTVECRADIFFHADPTDTGSAFDGEHWLALIEVEDAQAGYDFGSTPAPGIELTTLRAIDVSGAINYGALAVNTDTGAFNASTSVINQGNVEVDLEVTGTDLSDGASSFIPANQQKFSTSTFTYSACGATCDLLSSTTPVQLDVELTKPAIDTPPIADDVYWGIAIPFGINSAAHQGINVFTPVSP